MANGDIFLFLFLTWRELYYYSKSSLQRHPLRQIRLPTDFGRKRICRNVNWLDTTTNSILRHRQAWRPNKSAFSIVIWPVITTCQQEISQRLKHGNFGKSSSSEYDINYHRNDKRISLYRRLLS